jgi:hypothetical protein
LDHLVFPVNPSSQVVREAGLEPTMVKDRVVLDRVVLLRESDGVEHPAFTISLRAIKELGLGPTTAKDKAVLDQAV